MKRILFIDRFCPKPYDDITLETSPQGGTESTVTRIAEALAKAGDAVQVIQHNRESTRLGAVKYTGAEQCDSPTHIVSLRDARVAASAHETYPDAKSYVWYHDIPQPGAAFVEQADALIKANATAILVSDWHRQVFQTACEGIGYSGRISSVRIYNPVADDLAPDATEVDPDKFLFFSSPHKGLKETLEVFARFRDFKELQNVKLKIANPGYYKLDMPLPKGAAFLGELSHPEVIKELRSSFLVFHYNRVFPETFGLVHAEANAVGTPWISGHLGANYEIADHPHQIIDLSDVKGLIDRLILWRSKGRIRVKGNSSFKLSKCIYAWKNILK